MHKNRVIVEAVVSLGRSQRQVAAQYGVTQAWVSKLVARWRAGGWEAVEKQSTRPRTNPRATPPATVARIVELRTALASAGKDAGPATIRALLAREGLAPPAASTVHAILKRHGLVAQQPRKRPRSSYTRFEADLPNECWQSDFTHWALGDGTGAEVLLWLDDHSRYLVAATCHQPVTGRTVVAQFRAAVERHGPPAATLTDNGFVFTTRFRQGRNGFEAELAARGIEQRNGRPNHPQTQGKVERLNQTLKRFLAAQPPAADLPALQAQLDAFADHYNNERPHRSLAGRTPAEAYTARAKATPTGQPRKHWRVRHDKVHRQGTVTLRRAGRIHTIGLGAEHAGTHVRMLVHDLDVIVFDPTTGEIIRELTIDPDKKSQPRGLKPGPKKGSPPKGGRGNKKAS
jgi:transposase InsO family protein